MKQILHFLRQLEANNNRDWFMAHKDEYQQAQARFHEFTEQLIARIGEYDPTVRGLTVKDCTYRIYRDVRFSKDKSPYKTHFGCYICREGKKSPYSGYYFHIGTGRGDGYPFTHMLASGDYICDPKVLKIIREDIVNGDGDFHQIVQNCSPVYQLDSDNALRKVPKGFPTDSPWADYLKFKVYCLVTTVDDKFILGDNLAERVAAMFQPTKPFLDYINRAVDYVREEDL